MSNDLKSVPTFRGMERMDLSYLLHTSLRKICDSTPTSLAWNLFHCLEDDATQAFYDKIWTQMQAVQPADKAALICCLKDAVREHYPYAGTPSRAALYCTFKLFDDDDWRCYVCYLAEKLYPDKG